MNVKQCYGMSVHLKFQYQGHSKIELLWQEVMQMDMSLSQSFEGSNSNCENKLSNTGMPGKRNSNQEFMMQVTEVTQLEAEYFESSDGDLRIICNSIALGSKIHHVEDCIL